MNSKFVIIFITFILILYGLINYYVGLRGWQALNGISARTAYIWAGGVTLLALTFPLGRIIAPHMSHEVSKALIFIGSYWLAAMYYLFLILLISDLLRFIFRWTGVIPQSLRGQFDLVTLAVLASVVIILLFGTWNSLHPVIRNYEVTLDKKSSSLDTMRVVVVSDIHLGWIVGIDRLQKMTEMINSLNPDLVLLPGDIIDEGVDLAAEKEIPQVLQSLKPRWGSYACMGNHEYISGNADTVAYFLNRAGITVLRDQVLEVNGSFCIVGRDDASRRRFNGSERLDLHTLMADVDKNRLPIILLDHEPFNLDVSEKEGVDLQFSGHTHLGQLFPNNYVTGAIFENDWGYLRKNNFQIIVSCGFGTWGPPIRIGNRPEIVNVLVHFTPVASVE